MLAEDGLDRLSVREDRREKQPFSLRWIMVHMIEEYARHNGHADLIRESIDGVDRRMTDPAIRPATDEDWPRIWPFFDATVRAGETYAYPLDLTSDEAASLWMERPPGLTVVLEEEGEILGSAKMGPNRPGRGDHVGTASFMVAEAARGRGVGRRMAEYVVQWHRDQGFRGIQFNAVVETNTAAVRLWESLGLRDRRDGARRVPVTDARVRRAARDVPAALRRAWFSRLRRSPGGTPRGSPGTAPPPRAG